MKHGSECEVRKCGPIALSTTLIPEPPESPSDLKTVMVSSRTANIQWHHQSGEVTKFIVQYKVSSTIASII